MKVLLYQKNQEMFSKSGIGRAMKHQIRACEAAGVNYTIDPTDDYDVVHINTIDFDARKMAKRARKMGKKVVYHAHSTEEDFKDSFVFSNQIAPLFKRHLINSYNLGDLLITPTPYSKKILEGYGFKQPIRAISNGIDVDRFAYDAAKVSAFKQHFNLSETQKVVVSVGLFFERKGLPDFMRVAEKFPEVKFIWFGHTPLPSVPKSIRNAINNKPRNVIMPGYIAGDIIEGAYMSANAFFFPSYEETEGIVVLEALAAHCQTIVRNIGAYAPWLSDGKNCYMGENNEDFVRILEGVLYGSLPSTKEAGFMTACERSIEAVGKQLEAVYEEALTL